MIAVSEWGYDLGDGQVITTATDRCRLDPQGQAYREFKWKYKNKNNENAFQNGSHKHDRMINIFVHVMQGAR